jgi:hypothetical protein
VAKHERRTFEDETIRLDDNEFRDCKFNRCEISFAGGAIPVLDGNSFTDCSWRFDGAASRTLQFMTIFARSGPGMRQVIERTVKEVLGLPPDAPIQ